MLLSEMSLPPVHGLKLEEFLFECFLGAGTQIRPGCEASELVVSWQENQIFHRVFLTTVKKTRPQRRAS